MSKTMQISRPTLIKRSWHRRREIRFMLFVAAMLVIFWSWGLIQGPSRIAPPLAEKNSQGNTPVDLVVTSKFPAEEFHMGIYQEIGEIRGVERNDTFLYRVKPADVRMLSRKYWIETIRIAPPIKP